MPKAHLSGAAKRCVADAAFALLASLVVAFILASLSASGIITMKLAVILLAVAWLVGVAATFLLTHIWNPSHRHRLFFAVLLGIFLIFIGRFEYDFQPKEGQATSAVSLDYTIKLRCDPIQAKAGDLEEKGAWHFQIYGTPTNGQDPRAFFTQGPIIRGAPKPHQTGLYAPLWKCTLLNFGKEPVMDVHAKMKIIWLKPTHAASGRADGDIIASADFVTPPLDLGASSDDREAYFYIWNTSDSFIDAVIGGSVTLKRVGAEASEQAKLIDGDKLYAEPALWPAQKITVPAAAKRANKAPPPAKRNKPLENWLDKRIRDATG